MAINTNKNIIIPELHIGTSADTKPIPLLGFGTAAFPISPAETVKEAVIHAIEQGYRHFDTAFVYQSEKPLGDAISDAINRGLIQSRDEVFITSKLWTSDAHPHLVVPAIKQSLKNLGMEYLDLYLIHWPISSKPGNCSFFMGKEELMPMDFKSVWESMEECQALGLTKFIGVSNFSCKKLQMILDIAKIPPAVNQVEMNPLWQQKKLREFCKEKGIHITAYSPLGARGTPWGSNSVMDCPVLKDIADAKGKTIAQICVRWAYEQGTSVIVKSFNKERMRENIDIFDWELSQEDLQKIEQIPQKKGCPYVGLVSENGPYKSLDELWDGEVA